MDDNRKAKYEKLLAETRSDITEIEADIEKELAKVKERLASLQAEKKAQMIIYTGYCQLLGVPNDFEEEEEDEDLG